MRLHVCAVICVAVQVHSSPRQLFLGRQSSLCLTSLWATEVTKLVVKGFLSDCQVFRGCCKIGCQRSQKLFARLLERCVKNLHIDEYRWGFEDWAKQYWPNGARQCNGAIGKLSWIAPPGDSSWCWIYVYSFTQRRTEFWSCKCWLVIIQSVLSHV